MDSNPLKKVVEQLKKLPGISLRHAEKIAFSLIQFPDSQENLNGIIRELAVIEKCSNCGWIKEKNNSCTNCENHLKDSSIICVVESFSDKMSIDKTGDFKGIFHILGGLIAPIEGILPEQLFIEPLLRGTKERPINEIIFAFPASIEAEATIQYITDRIDNKAIIFSRIARGIPTGSRLEHIDRETISQAVRNRKKFTSQY